MRRYVAGCVAAAALVVAGCAGGQTRVSEGQAAAEMTKTGARVKVSEKTEGQPVTEVNLSDVPITDASLNWLDSLPHLQKLDLGHTKSYAGQGTITDAGLAHVAGLVELRRLSLTNTDVTDAGLAHLKGLARLESLNLERTKVTDEGLKHLLGLTKLQTLKLQGTAVTREGAQKVREALPGCKISL